MCVWKWLVCGNGQYAEDGQAIGTDLDLGAIYFQISPYETQEKCEFYLEKYGCFTKKNYGFDRKDKNATNKNWI